MEIRSISIMATQLSTQSYPQPNVKLDNTNYREWSVFVYMFLPHRISYATIDGNLQPSATSDEKVADWNDVDYQARGIIT